MIYKIESRQNSKIKDLVKLSNPKFSKEQNLFKIEGFHSLEMALESGQVKSLFVTKEIKGIDEQIPQYVISNEIMQSISYAKSPQGVIAVCEIKKEEKITSNKVLCLDNVSDPGNLGTLLRTALAFGYKDVVLIDGCYLFNEKVLQSTQGAIFKLNVIDGFDQSKFKNYEIIATDLEGTEVSDIKSSKDKFVLVLGNEAHGVSEKMLKLADKRIKIRMGDIDSLNVAVAGAIAMYELGK